MTMHDIPNGWDTGIVVDDADDQFRILYTVKSLI